MAKWRAYQGGDDLRAIQKVASCSWPADWHPGGLGWAMHGPVPPVAAIANQGARDVALLDDEGSVVAWVGPIEPDEVCVQLDPSRADMAGEVVERALAMMTPADVIKVRREEVALRAAFDAAPQLHQVDGTLQGMSRAATTDIPRPPTGYVVRSVEPGEEAARVEVHRSAWLPSSLPWAPGHRPEIAPDATSSFTAEVYASVRDTWLYDRELDLVAVADDGTFAACCLVWLDHATGIAEIEPLGVVPEHRRRGLAGALCHEALARVAAAGGKEVYIATGPSEAYPHSSQAYAKAGFEVWEPILQYRLRP